MAPNLAGVQRLPDWVQVTGFSGCGTLPGMHERAIRIRFGWSAPLVPLRD